MKPWIFVFCLIMLFTAVAAVAQDPADPAPAPAAAPAEAAPEPAPAEAGEPASAEAAPEPSPAEAAAAPALEDIRQVQVQVWITETNETGLRRIGNNLNYTRFDREVEQNGSVQQVNTNVYDPMRNFPTVTLPSPSPNSPKPPYYSQNNNPPFAQPGLRPDESGSAGLQTRTGAGLTYSIIASDCGTLDGVFRALENKTDVDLMSKPELLVVNNTEATIKAGGQVPYQTVTYPKGEPNLSMAWKDIGVNLKLTPTIMPNNTLQLNIAELDVTDVSRIENLRGVDLPVFAKRSQTGFVFVPDGETLVIGGLSSRTIRKSERRVPILGKLPILGIPFRGRQSDADITHLLIFVQPTIVDLREMSERSSSAITFWRNRGDEWANADRIESEIKAMESDL
jgi:type II secretory pathway component GspD/PulD (secretin)